VVSRKWITTLVCADESSVQVEVAFTASLAAEDLPDAADARATEALRAALLSGDRDRVAVGPALPDGLGLVSETGRHTRGTGVEAS
jgi:putative transposase